jgi:hypothetical protein
MADERVLTSEEAALVEAGLCQGRQRHRLLTAEEVAAMRDELSKIPDHPHGNAWNRIVAILEALMADREQLWAACGDLIRRWREAADRGSIEEGRAFDECADDLEKEVM